MMAEARERRRTGARGEEAGVTRGQGPGEPGHGAFRPQHRQLKVVYWAMGANENVNSPIRVSIIPLVPLVSAVWSLQGLEQAPLRVAEEVTRLDLSHQQLGQVAVGGGEVVV